MSLERRVWLWFVPPAIICLSFLFSVGPTIQETLVGLLSSDAPTVYASAYKDSLVEFPTLGEWLLLGFHWLYLLMTAPPVLFAMCTIRFSQFIVRLAAMSFVILCVADVIFGVRNGTLTLSAFLINSAVNLAGSLLLILVLGVMFWSYEKVRDLAPARLADYSSAATLVLLGVLLSSLCYFALTYFYQPLSTNFELVAKMPIHGGYVGQKEEEQEVGERARAFSILPEALKGGRGHATIPGDAAIIENLEEFQSSANRLRIARANGWSRAARIEDSQLVGKYLGKAELIIIESGLAELTIDGASVETRDTYQFIGLGEMDGRYDDDLSLHVRGKARAVWLDSKRRNPTRWERLPLEVQLFILTAAFAVLSGFLRVLQPIVLRFREDKPLGGLT